MDYRKFGESYYIRMDRDDEIVASLLEVCEREGVCSATFSGIGGCKTAEIQVFDPERGVFEGDPIEGVLELVSILGNVIQEDDGRLSWHAHALFAYQDEEGGHRVAAGHLKSAVVLYTAEIELRPVIGGTIGARLDPETGTSFWDFGRNAGAIA